MSGCDRRESNPRNFMGPARISLVSWRGRNYMAEVHDQRAVLLLGRFEADIWCSPRQDPEPQTPISCRARNQLIPDCLGFGSVWPYRDPCVQLTELHSDP